MMNFLALGLVLTSLITAGFFSPSPQLKPTEDVIVKEGHRVVVVEYEKDDGNTKVFISPKDSIRKVDEKGVVERLSEKMEEGVEEEVGNEEGGIHHMFRPTELVCDAYGKCKHKISSAFGKTKEAASEKAHEAAEKVYGAEEAAREAVSEAAGKVKDTFAQSANKASHKVQEVKDSANMVSSKAKEKVSEKATALKDETAGRMEGAKEMVEDKAKAVEEAAVSASDRAKEGARRVRKQGQKELREILEHAREVAGDVFNYVAPPERVAPVAGVLHLMGFSAAYGMCLWITFASSYVLARALPRQQFAMVQTKIYPVYFKAMAYSVALALLGHLIGSRQASAAVLQGLNLSASLAMILSNLLWLEPRATKVMLERMKKEKEEGSAATDPVVRFVAKDPNSEAAASAKAQIVRTLHRLNSYSSFLNASVLLLLTWHLVNLGQRLHSEC